MYIRVWKVLIQKPFRLWGISLLSLLLASLATSLAVIPLLVIAIDLLLGLGMARIYLRGYRGQENHVENLFDGFVDSWLTAKSIQLKKDPRCTKHRGSLLFSKNAVLR